MPALLVLARAGLRRRWRQLLGLAVVLALGGGVAIASLEAAARTGRAYPSYLRRSGVSELVVNPSFNTDRAEEVIASTPGIKGYASDSLLTATADNGDPRTQAEVDAGGLQVLVSTDGRYTRQDRPVVHQGRMIRSGAEAFVNVEMAEALSLHVGDALPLSFWAPGYTSPDRSSDSGAVVEPIGRAEPRVVGVGVFPDEVLVDGLFPRIRVLVTPEVGSRFNCTLPHPSADDTRSVEQFAATLVPRDCSASYRYFSLQVDGGDCGVGPLIDALVGRFGAENERLPAALGANGIGFEVTPTLTGAERQRVQRSLDPPVTALRLFGAAAAASTLVVVLLGAVRIARRDENGAGVWRALGASRALRTAGIALPLAAAAAVGLTGSLVVGWLASGAGPVASARAVDPAGRLGLSPVVVMGVLGGSAIFLTVGIVAAARAASRSLPSPVSGAKSRLSRATAGMVNPSVVLGIRAASAGSGGRALLAGSVTAVAAVLATLVFGASLSGLVSDPRRFGWPYDVAVMLNYGYAGTTDLAAVAATLDRPEVRRWGVASVSNTVTIKDRTVPSVASRSGFDAMRLPVIEGDLPTSGDEIALGAKTAEALGLGVGDRTLVRTSFGERKATVRGLVVLPPVGAFLADRSSLGTGALLSAQFFDEVVADAERDAGMAPGGLADSLAGFVAVDLRPGVGPERFIASISDQLTTWDATGARPFVYTRPVRPATVANVAAMRTVPVALTALLAGTMAIGLMLAIAVATRARRRELAVLRALGCVGRQLRATVRWQALTVVGAGLALGIPLGLAIGRVAYRAFAKGLGVAPDPLVPLPGILLLVVVTIGTGLLAAAGPGRRAARIAAGEALRHE